MRPPHDAKNGKRILMLATNVDPDIEHLAEVMADPEEYAETFLKIRDKSKRLIPFRANAQQRRLWQVKQWCRDRNRGFRILILKARQMGVTTHEQLDSYWRVARIDGESDGVHTITLAHDKESTEQIFQIALRCYDHHDEDLKPHRKWESGRELHFDDLDSTFGIRTAGAKAGGRGLTLTKVHGSEVAQWSQADVVHAGLNEAVPSNGEIVYESTPFGAAGLFYESWQTGKDANGVITLDGSVEATLRQAGHAGRSRWLPLFFPWFQFPEYQVPLDELDELGPLTDREEQLGEAYHLTLEQLKFRRLKIGDYNGREEIFDQEYPSDDVTCFLLSGRRIFDLMALQVALAHCVQPVEVLRWFGAELRIYEHFKEGHRYVVGSDSSEGIVSPDTDPSSIQVFDRDANAQVAVLSGYITPHQHAVCLDRIGRKGDGQSFRGYANPKHGPALLVPEVNNTGHAVVSTLLHELRYPRWAIYHYAHYADPDRERDWRPGWRTDTATRWILIDDLGELINHHRMLWRDKETVSELIAFQMNDDGKPGAPEGAHDDHVIAAGCVVQGFGYTVPKTDWSTLAPSTVQHHAQKRTW